MSMQRQHHPVFAGRFRFSQIRVYFALLAAVALVTTACGSASRESASPQKSGARSDTGYSVSMDTMEMEMQVESEIEEKASGFIGQTEAGQTIPANTGRKLIRTVSMEVETDSFDTLIPEINKKAAELGGYIEESETSGSGVSRRNEPVPRYANITARIPADKLDLFTAAMENGGNVTYKSETTTDVSLQYSDLESKKKSLEMEQDRIWALLEKADSLDAVIALEQRLSEIRYELESMQSQLKLYDNQVDYSTVTLHISEVTVYTPIRPESIGQRIQTGFSTHLKEFTSISVNLLVGLISTLPLWAPLLLIALAVLYAVRKRKFKKNRRAQEIS